MDSGNWSCMPIPKSEFASTTNWFPASPRLRHRFLTHPAATLLPTLSIRLTSLPSILCSTRCAQPKSLHGGRALREPRSEFNIQQLKTSQPALFSPTRALLQSATTVPHTNAFPLGTRQGSVLLSPYCPNSPIGLTHYSQITDYFCVDAARKCSWSITAGITHTQNQIAALTLCESIIYM